MDKFSSYTDETDLDNIKIFVNSISNIKNKWLTVTSKQPGVLETYINLKPDEEIIKIVCEQRNNKIISPIFEAVLSQNKPCVEETKLF